MGNFHWSGCPLHLCQRKIWATDHSGLTLPHHGQQFDSMVMQFFKGGPLADETDCLLGVNYLRTRDNIDPVIEENGSKGSCGAKTQSLDNVYVLLFSSFCVPVPGAVDGHLTMGAWYGRPHTLEYSGMYWFVDRYFIGCKIWPVQRKRANGKIMAIP